MPRRLLIAALAAALLALLVAAPAAFADAFTPESGGSSNADDIDTLYKITLYIGLVIFLIVEGTLLWSLVRHRARRGGPEAAQIRGNTPLELGLDARGRADPRGADRRDVPLPPRHREPAGLRPGRPARVAGAVRVDRPAQPAPGRRSDPADQGQRPAVPLALRLRPRQPLFTYQRDGRPGEHDGRPRDNRLRRHPLLVDPQAGRQGRRRARSRERDLVQDPGQVRGHDLQRPVRGAVRRQPRRHARRGPGSSRRSEFQAWAEAQRDAIQQSGEDLAEQREQREDDEE